MRIVQGMRPEALIALALLLIAGNFAPAVAQRSDRAEAEFYKGYYLQHERKDLRKAIDAYKRSIELNAKAATRRAVDTQMAAIQEQLATSDFAQLMPPDAIAYAEISNPANHLEQIAKLMGLTGRSAKKSSDVVVLRLDEEIAIPSDFQISPALLRELKKIRGAAVALTDVSNRGPKAVAVIHPGDSDLVTGLVETGIQLVPAANQIAGYPTFQIEDEAWVVKAGKMIVVSTEKSAITQCLNRVDDSSAKSLADQAAFQAARKQNESPALFAFVNPKQALKKLGPKMDQEIAIARMVMDLDHMNHVAAYVTSTDQGLQASVDVDFDENHRSFGYGLIRTVPLSGNSLAHVPSGAVAVVGMGLNPKMLMAAEVAGSQHLTALDIGREVFANIEELGVFVLPSVSNGNEVPDFGVVVASSNIEKSQSLWNTLLSLPTEMKIEDGPRASSIEIEGTEARQYSFPGGDVPELIIARLGKSSLIAGTENAVRTAIKAKKNGKTLAKDAKAKPLWQAKTEHTAKAAFVHVGRALRMAASMERGRDAQEMAAIANVIDDLNLTLVVNEQPNHFAIQLNATGLPLFENVVKTLAGQGSQPSPSDGDATVSVEQN